ncbi:MAG TPA: hypothetical protein PLD00_04350 [Methanofastidiosum sp.]|nr:MAG: hypothetical protein BWX72_00115 [Firmicutes bacterium ADurb.Bin080]HPX24477.1 hypothetical protein [Methanofastidiosum sp.]
MKRLLVLFIIILFLSTTACCLNTNDKGILWIEVFWSKTSQDSIETLPFIKNTIPDQIPVEYIELSEGTKEEIIKKIFKFRTYNLEKVPSIVIHKGLSGKVILQGKYEVEKWLKQEVE